jgi:hypothetical protein
LKGEKGAIGSEVSWLEELLWQLRSEKWVKVSKVGIEWERLSVWIASRVWKVTKGGESSRVWKASKVARAWEISVVWIASKL